jgi:hypothetical protein
LAESGQENRFEMKAEEVSKKDAEKLNAAIIPKTSFEKPKIRYEVYEMADGATVSFPVKAEGIAKESVKNTNTKEPN